MVALDNEIQSPVGHILDDIVCGVDGSRASYAAVRQAATLANDGAQLTLVAVPAVRGGGTQRTAAIAPVRARRSLDHGRRLALAAGAGQVELEIDEGYPVTETLFKHSRSHGLLAIGAPFMPRAGHLLVGGTATLAAHVLPNSLLVARVPRRGRFCERILVASDASPASDRLVEFAVDLALAHDSELVLVHAMHDGTGAWAPVIDAQVESVRRRLGERASAHVEQRRPLSLILETAGAASCSLIVVASRRVGGIRALGSVSERVVHKAHCSVLIVRPEDLDAGERRDDRSLP